jgi:streptogramin lyase
LGIGHLRAFSALNEKGNGIRRLDQKGREVVRYSLTDPEKHPTGR